MPSDIEEHLKSINMKMNEINDHKLKIINGIFSKIEEAYSECRDRIEDMREFFRTNKISGGHYVEINFDPSKAYPITWIRSLNKEIAAKAQNVGLFKMFETENEGADAIILKAFLEHSDGKNVKPDIKEADQPEILFRSFHPASKLRKVTTHRDRRTELHDARAAVYRASFHHRQRPSQPQRPQRSNAVFVS